MGNACSACPCPCCKNEGPKETDALIDAEASSITKSVTESIIIEKENIQLAHEPPLRVENLSKVKEIFSKTTLTSSARNSLASDKVTPSGPAIDCLKRSYVCPDSTSSGIHTVHENESEKGRINFDGLTWNSSVVTHQSSEEGLHSARAIGVSDDDSEINSVAESVIEHEESVGYNTDAGNKDKKSTTKNHNQDIHEEVVNGSSFLPEACSSRACDDPNRTDTPRVVLEETYPKSLRGRTLLTWFEKAHMTSPTILEDQGPIFMEFDLRKSAQSEELVEVEKVQHEYPVIKEKALRRIQSPPLEMFMSQFCSEIQITPRIQELSEASSCKLARPEVGDLNESLNLRSESPTRCGGDILQRSCDENSSDGTFYSCMEGDFDVSSQFVTPRNTLTTPQCICSTSCSDSLNDDTPPFDDSRTPNMHSTDSASHSCEWGLSPSVDWSGSSEGEYSRISREESSGRTSGDSGDALPGRSSNSSPIPDTPGHRNSDGSGSIRTDSFDSNPFI